MSANSQNLTITTIKPTSGLSVSFKPRSKEGEAEKLEVHASYFLPKVLAAISNQELVGFASRAYKASMLDLLKQAVKDAKETIAIPSLSELYPESTKREFTVTKEALINWFDSFADKILSAAISAKAGLPADSVKVTKKVLQYKELILALAKRGDPMKQEDIDAVIRVLGLIDASGNNHHYTDNVAQGVAVMQEKLDRYLAGKQEEEELEEIDF